MNAGNIINANMAETAIPKNTIVKYGSADKQVIKGAAVSDLLLGVSPDVDTAINEMCDVVVSGIANVKLGGTVTRGNRLTTDASGNAVAAAPAAGVNNNIIGQAMASGVSGDVIPAVISLGAIQG